MPAVRWLSILLAAAAVSAPALSAPAAESTDEPRARFLSRTTQGLYFDGTKVGWRTFVVRRVGGLFEIKDDCYWVRRAGAARIGTTRTLEARVHPDGRPESFTCEVVGEREWTVEGRTDGDHLVMERTVGEQSATTRVPLREGLALRSWVPVSVALGDEAARRRGRWDVIDPAVGAVLPDPMTIRNTGKQTLRLPNGRTASGTGVMWSQGPERVAELIGARGRRIRSVWQSTPLVGRSEAFSAARRLGAAAERVESPVDFDAIRAGRYRETRYGYRVYLPPFPFVPHAVEEMGIVRIVRTGNPGDVTIRPASDVSKGRLSSAGAEQLDGMIARLQGQWAKRYDSVDAEDPEARGVSGLDGRSVRGTARLGCTTYHFHNRLVLGHGLAYFVTTRSADRPIRTAHPLLRRVSGSLGFDPPSGPMPVRVDGLRVAVPFFGLSLRRPSDAWKVVPATSGPATVLQLARAESEGALVIRLLEPGPGDRLKHVAAHQARQAAQRVGGEEPEPEAARLAGRDALALAYEGDLVDGEPSRCRAVYAPLGWGDQIVAVFAVSRKGAAGTGEELDAMVESLEFGPDRKPDEAPGEEES